MAQTDKLICPACGAEMNHHATKLDYGFDDQAVVDPVFDGVLNEVYTCPKCGHIEVRT